MSQQSKKTIIDVADGYITNENNKDKVILLGEFPFEGSNYTDKIELVINRYNNIPISINFPYSGYDMQLFVGDFTGDDRDDVMIRGAYGGSGGFEIGVIYRYEDNKLIEIFNQEKFSKDNTCSAKFKNNYKVSVNCSNKKYLIDLSKKPKEYLNEIYDENKQLKSELNATIDQPNAIFPVKTVYNDYYQLIIKQRIVGTVNIDTLGVIQSFVDLKDNKTTIIYKGLLSFPYEEVEDISKAKRNKKRSKKSFKEGSKLINSQDAGRGIVYVNNNFRIEKDNMNFIINSMYEINDTLFVEGNFLNMKTYIINNISNFKLRIKDENDFLIGEKTFKKIYIGESLKPLESKKITLKFNRDEYNILNSSMKNISWNYSYDSRSK